MPTAIASEITTPEINDDFTIEAFLREEEHKDLLRFSTAGSVDDGKSTLIGRLLVDSRNVYEDQLRSVTNTKGAGGEEEIDLARLTDGLRAEREQGITIDVAYRYFATRNRKFIIADTPGHEQYTRNMATGASTANLAIILIDARKGLLPQSRRHTAIATLLGTRHLVACVNKMDLVDYSEEVFNNIVTDFRELVHQYGGSDPVCIPVSALVGDNVVDRTDNTLWYTGPTLLEHLEAVPVWDTIATHALRMPVQRVIRPNQDYRGFAGQISSGTLHVGDRIIALPSGSTSRVKEITTYDGNITEASAPLSIAFTLEDEVDISRGDLIATPDALPQSAATIEASLVWFDTQRLETHRTYLLKHGASTHHAVVSRVIDRTNLQSFTQEAVSSLGMNDIGVVELSLTRPLFFDPYKDNRATGAFILIDSHTNATLAAGMIRSGVSQESSHRIPALVLFSANTPHNITAIEHSLLTAGVDVIRTRIARPEILRGLFALGLTVLLETEIASEVAEPLREFHPITGTEFADAKALVSKLRDLGVITTEKA
ncbi:MAG: sulfate adenylyltransferase subunit CysN [Bryocella sp.]